MESKLLEISNALRIIQDCIDRNEKILKLIEKILEQDSSDDDYPEPKTPKYVK